MPAIRGAPMRALALPFLSVALLCACATPSGTPADRTHSGRFAVTTALGEQRESVSGRFSLEVRGAQQVLELASPLGTTVARIEIEPGGARAIGARMQEVRGADADALTEQLLGWPLPVSGLADWIEGRAVPQRVARIERDGGRIGLIEQDGWTIRLAEYFENTARPRRLELERPAAANTPSVTLRLIVDEPG
ncbi:MAG TPA: outer membrane lipoprotein LolB [Burkholderiaceae bacterium]|nr:outer membrane lipoprotein LolB [Burkholderiaceae bacterium]